MSDKTIDEVRSLPIEEVIGKYMGTELKRSGHSFKGCCPLPNHGEKTPSFYVTPAKNMFNCFGCGAGGDGIRFVMLHDSLSFLEAVRSIAGQHSITVQESKAEQKTDEQKKEEAVMAELLELTQKKYRSLL